MEEQLANTQAELQELNKRQLQLELLLEKTHNTEDGNLQDKVSCLVLLYDGLLQSNHQASCPLNLLSNVSGT